MEYKIFIAIIVVAIVMVTSVGQVDAKKSASQSGYQHGVDDCNGNHDDMYITGVNKHGESTGPDHHTQAFNEAYYRGWSDAGCSTQELNDILYPQIYSDNVNTAIDDSNFDDHSVSQPQNQQAFTSQSAGCPEMLLNGNCVIGQDQNTKNTFGQANDNN